MKAIVCDRWGGPEVLRLAELPSPQAGPDEIVVAPRAWGVNFADLVLIGGTYHARPPFPFAPGMEVAGEVIRVGSGGASAFRIGDRVAAYAEWGGFAQEVVVKAGAAMKLPEEMSDTEGAVFPTTFGTAYIALVYRAGLRAGETLLVTGAGGGVGLAAVQIGRKLGATVIAAAGSSEKLALAKANGAEYLIDYNEENLSDRVKDMTGGRGVDVVFDPVGADAFDACLRCVAFEGRVVIIGFAGGRIPSASAGRILIKSCSVMGSSWTFSLLNRPERIAETLDMLTRWYRDGAVRPHVSAVMLFEQAGEALSLVANRSVKGKIVLTEQD
ncbi:NADPH:quinone oxidoreductase family protein [Oceanibacterium hippocampi]|uniref:Quinone oxidoreductase 1 n=1 Tax=Oceanibacterium hippocampi TaxID=745714 RepID=A0A1Y5TTF5_9PROT|nr:NADPH:quinone oxidoreductase family protein [Oceanibacterium hippocampi]SLN71132.1 Quinone oxidoreductase 1 [Oceanibacterium hippocampi]